MIDYVEIGATPAGEDCEQLGVGYDPARARKECTTFIAQLRRQFGPEPEGARLKIRGNPHDFGTYLEVACLYDSRFPDAEAYAIRCDNETPEHWDEVSRANLGLI